MMKCLQKTIKLLVVLFCITATARVTAQTNLLTTTPSFESGTDIGPGSSLGAGQWSRTKTGDQSNVTNYIYKEGLGNTTGAPVAQDGNYYMEAVTPDNLLNDYAKLNAQNGQNLLTLGKGITFRIFFYYQNTADHSFKAWVRTSSGANVGEIIINTVANTWTEAYFDYLIPTNATSTSANLRFDFGLNEGTTRIDNVRIYDLSSLPVNLKSFSATKGVNSVRLTWETLEERDNSHYEILRSSDGKEFTHLKTIKAFNEAGGYSCEDNTPGYGYNYYKLVQFDQDGTFKELGLKSVYYNISTDNISIYPNPFINVITIKDNLFEAQKAIISISNSVGQIVRKESFNGYAGDNIYRMNVESLSPGAYVVLYEAGDTKETYKVIK